MDFDVILRMDWLSQYYATVDCWRKEVIFRISNVEEFKFVGDKSSAPQNLISAIIARKMLRRACQGYLTLVRNVEADKGAVEKVPVVCEFLDVFPKELSSYHLTERLNSVSTWFLAQLLSLCRLIGWLLQN